MRKILIALVLFACALSAQAQLVDKYWVRLKDKAGSDYTLDNPHAFLSQRALDRRARFGVALDSLDLPVSESYIRTLQDLGLMVQNSSKWLNGVTIFVPEGTDVSYLDTLPFVLSTQLVETHYATVPHIGGHVPTWNPLQPSGSTYEPFSRTYYAHAYTQIKQLNGIDLHRQGYEGQGIIIGVCDGGFPGIESMDLMDSLRADGRLMTVRDFVWLGDSVFSIHPHGTSVLSLMASYKPGMMVGTAPRATYVLCRTENTLVETLLEEYNWAAAAEYLDSLGADIITSSLGYFYFDYNGHNHTLADLDGNTAPMSIASNIAATRGMLVINAAGNDGMSNPQHLGAPADAELVLTVGAATHDGTRASFSSYGPTADGRVKPDVMALGEEVPCANADGNLNASNGTSLACPIMAGMMACLWQRYPDWTPAQLCDSVRAWGNFADHPDLMAGYGIPDFGLATQSPTDPEGIAHPESASVRLYPNPVHDQFHVVSPSPCNITICDAMGREVYKDKNINTVSVSHLPKGIYFVIISSSDACSTHRLMVE